MKQVTDRPELDAKYADMLAALGSETRLKVLKLLLRNHPDGLVVAQLIEELGGSASTLSHHLDKLKHEGLITAEKEGTFLRYRADASSLVELLGFILSECCSRNQVIDPRDLMACVSPSSPTADQASPHNGESSSHE